MRRSILAAATALVLTGCVPAKGASVIDETRVRIDGHTLRIFGLSAPSSVAPACEAEAAAAEALKARLASLLMSGGEVSFQKTGMACLSFMTCDAFVRVDGVDIVTTLLAEGLAADRSADPPHDWCAAHAPPPAEPEAPPGPQTLETTGVIAAMKDAGYPMFSLELDPGGGAERLGLLLNAEEADLGGKSPEDWLGQSARVGYTAAEEAFLLDVAVDGRPLLLTDPDVRPAAGVIRLAGVLAGAGAVTASDLPDIVTLTAPDGRTVEFEVYITPDLVGVNGQTVTADYTLRRVLRAVSLAPAG